jgi:hypothetical protein
MVLVQPQFVIANDKHEDQVQRKIRTSSSGKMKLEDHTPDETIKEFRSLLIDWATGLVDHKKIQHTKKIIASSVGLSKLMVLACQTEAEKTLHAVIGNMNFSSKEESTQSNRSEEDSSSAFGTISSKNLKSVKIDEKFKKEAIEWIRKRLHNNWKFVASKNKTTKIWKEIGTEKTPIFVSKLETEIDISFETWKKL